MASTDSTEVLDRVLKDFKSSWDYCASSWHDRWKDNYALYNNQRVNIGYEGITDTFVPMTFSTIETMTSALFGTKPKFNYFPPQEKQDQKTDILNALLDFYWDKDQWSLKIINTGRNMLRLGTAVDYFCWEGDHPVLINVPIRDFFIDPTASSLETAKFMGRRFLTTVSDLKEFEIVDLEAKPDVEGNYPMKKKYSNLDQIMEGSQEDNTDKQEKDIFYGSTVSEPEKTQVEVIEWWTEDRVVSIANRTVVIEDTDNYYKAKSKANGEEYPKGVLPFADCRDYVDESLFYAKGEIDFIGGEQELLNDVTNQNIDSITYILNQMSWIDAANADRINEVENLPGAVYPFEVHPIQRGTVPPEAFNERQNIKNEMRETTASNEVIKGANAEGANPTATEINAQVAGAGQRINLKVTQIENGYFHRVASIVFEMVKLYVTKPMMVRIMGRDGAQWQEFDPAEFQGEYEPKVQLDITIQQNKQKQAAQAKDMLAAFLNDPNVNQQELTKLVLQRAFELDPDEVNLLVTPQMGMPGMPQDPMGGQPMMPPQMAPQLPQPMGAMA